MQEERAKEILAPVQSFSMRKGKLSISFLIRDSKRRIQEVRLRHRTKEDIYYVFETKKIRRKDGILYHCILNPDLFALECGDCDITVVIRENKECYEAVLGGQSKIRKYGFILFPRWIRSHHPFILYPYVNGQKQFTIQIRKYQPEYDSWRFIMKVYLALLCYYLLKPYWDRKRLWLVGEKFSSLAQDNGIAFFKYCMENLSEEEKKHIYYVLDPKTENYRKLNNRYPGHMMPFMTFRYLILLQAAEVLISSDSIRHFYIWDAPNTIYKPLLKKRKKIIFLQHGVTAFKHTHDTLGKYGKSPMNRFVVTSEFERDIVHKYYKYDFDEILLTGFPRWDNLFDRSREEHKEILIMPTWRNWLEHYTEEEFIQTEYFKNYKLLLNDEILRKELEEKDIYINFCIHPFFKEYTSLFDCKNPRIRIIAFGTDPISELLAECKMIVTDYSSVSWDVYYQGKPVVFYVFDQKQYETRHGSYVDMAVDGFGDLAYNHKEIIEILQYYIDHDFQEKKIYADKRSYLLPYRDNKNSERVYQEVLKYTKRNKDKKK